MPPASETASFIQMLSFLIPIGALSVLLITAPSIRKSLLDAKDNYRNYFYGDTVEEAADENEKLEKTTDSSKSNNYNNSEIHSVDHSIYDIE
jgi:hypothetical protein